MRSVLKLLSAVAAFVGCVSTVHAAITYQTGSNTNGIPGLTGFATNGAMMDGLSVRTVFSGGQDETRLWADTGATSGGVSGTNWSLTMTGDTFSGQWVFTMSQDLGQIELIVLDGLNALTVFDRTFGGVSGTPDSANGTDWVCASGLCDTATVTYDYQVSIGLAAPVGDLWQTVSIDFGDVGPRTNFSFTQDTDNDSRLTQVPEPGVPALLGIAMAAIWFARRKPNTHA